MFKKNLYPALTRSVMSISKRRVGIITILKTNMPKNFFVNLAGCFYILKMKRTRMNTKRKLSRVQIFDSATALLAGLAPKTKVRMVTGDNLQTEKAIALERGILDSDAAGTEPKLIEGKVFRALLDYTREEIAEKILVMGRSSPNGKLLLVKALNRRGHVLAVTGDGTNDAPALHEADIGLVMGIAGMEVAKESSDIDDNFSSVVKVVPWGHSVYSNNQKFIQFQLTVNIAALIINVVAGVTTVQVPLNAVQLLGVNLTMDTLGALALAAEPPTDHPMLRSPVARREPLITNIMRSNLLVQALCQVRVPLVLDFMGKNISFFELKTDYAANTLIFNAFSLCQIVIIEFLGKFTDTIKLNWKQWLISVAISAISWPLATCYRGEAPASTKVSLEQILCQAC
ncbi:hypothetical protein AQUCO_09600034v1 [Aquilegia coerulea]|uniref:Cation-transporting P-type ATPase C-terminal domain-containing protein n=1 Tax=Aquilegia coerulea TaxID=218851 RepID=A0A2G5C4G1_AQUCA|nr:hypothetical protein AQUCO_09600034v1 [Aquilegia coerulea]